MKEENPPFKLVGIAILSDRPQFLSMSRKSSQEKQEKVGEAVSIPRWTLETEAGCHVPGWKMASPGHRIFAVNQFHLRGLGFQGRELLVPEVHGLSCQGGQCREGLPYAFVSQCSFAYFTKAHALPFTTHCPGS